MTFIDFEVQRKKHQRRHLLLRDWGHQPSISGPDFPGRQAIPVAPTPPGTPLGLVGAIGHPAVRAVRRLPDPLLRPLWRGRLARSPNVRLHPR